MPPRWTSMRVNANCLSQVLPAAPCATAAPSCDGNSTLGISDLSREPRPLPMPNLSNFLNPNNVYYNHTLAEMYRNMPKQDKDELWMMDMLLRKAGLDSCSDAMPAMASMSPAQAALKKAHTQSMIAIQSALQDSNSPQANTLAIPPSACAMMTEDAAWAPSALTSRTSISARSSTPSQDSGPQLTPAALSSADTIPLEAYLSSLTASDVNAVLMASQGEAPQPPISPPSAAATIAAEVPLTTSNLYTWAAVMMQMSHMLPDVARSATMELVDAVLVSSQAAASQQSDMVQACVSPFPTAHTSAAYSLLDTVPQVPAMPQSTAVSAAYLRDMVQQISAMPAAAAVSQNSVEGFFSISAPTSRQNASRLAVASYPSSIGIPPMSPASSLGADAYTATQSPATTAGYNRSTPASSVGGGAAAYPTAVKHDMVMHCLPQLLQEQTAGQVGQGCSDMWQLPPAGMQLLNAKQGLACAAYPAGPRARVQL